jgi:pimeloyl-ACP methyl ester carboxylesterase
MEKTRLNRMRDNLAPHKAAMLAAGLPAFAARDARRIDVPVLILTSERATGFQRHLNHYLGSLLPRVSERAVPAVGHFMHEDNPEETARLSREFIADLELR